MNMRKCLRERKSPDPEIGEGSDLFQPILSSGTEEIAACTTGFSLQNKKMESGRSADYLLNTGQDTSRGKALTYTTTCPASNNMHLENTSYMLLASFCWLLHSEVQAGVYHL